MISAQALIEKFRQALEEGWGYIWGTAGVQWTAAKQKALEKTTDPDRALGRRYGSKWTGHKVADCSGLFSWAFKQLGGYMYHGSDTMYRKYCVSKGELNRGKRTDCAALKPGTAVFVWNGKKYSHVGMYAGDGVVIEAMGTLRGVTTTKITDTKWKRWGELAGVDYTGSNSGGSAAAGEILQDVQDDRKPTVRKGSRGEAVRVMQGILQRLGYDLGPCGADGDFGKCTDAAVRKFQKDRGLAVDGICGKNTWKELTEA